MQWFRFYDEVLDDPKVQQLPAPLFRYWANLLCLANKGTPRGAVPNDMQHVAYKLRVSPTRAEVILRDLESRGLFKLNGSGQWEPHNWCGRQRKSDNVAERVASHRAKQQPYIEEEDDETFQSDDRVTLHVTPPDTDTEQNRTEAEKEAEQSRAESASAPKPAPSSRRKKKITTTLPDDWDQIQDWDALYEWAHKQLGMQGPAVDYETDKFLDHWRGNAEEKADWLATWRNWMRRSREPPRRR